MFHRLLSVPVVNILEDVEREFADKRHHSEADEVALD